MFDNLSKDSIERYFQVKVLLKELETHKVYLEHSLDFELTGEGVRLKVSPSGYIYSYSDVEPTLGLDGETFLPFVEDLGLEWSDVYKTEVDHQKVAELVTAGRIPGDSLPKFTKEVKRGYRLHNVRKAKEHELEIAMEDDGVSSGS